jgi:hypothetical protein
MTLDQVLAFGLIGITVAAFVWDRLPYDVVALTALTVGIVIGLVPADKAFSGFSDDIVIIVGAALVLSAAIAPRQEAPAKAEEREARCCDAEPNGHIVEHAEGMAGQVSADLGDDDVR